MERDELAQRLRDVVAALEATIDALDALVDPISNGPFAVEGVGEWDLARTYGYGQSLRQVARVSLGEFAVLAKEAEVGEARVEAVRERLATRRG